MAKLNQILAIEKSVKVDAQRVITDAYHIIQKKEPLSGVMRTYRPRDEEGEELPPESTKVQIKVDDVLTNVADVMTGLFDITATKDKTNTVAKANIVVDGKILAADVPATYLLFLEKQLVDLLTFVRKLPTLDPSEEWEHDLATDLWATPPVEKTRTKKLMRNHVKAEATTHHPAQVEVYTEDVVVGYWRTIKFSGAVQVSRVNQLIERLTKLQAAVKFAREEANGTEVVDLKPGKAIMDYIFE